MGDPLNNAAIQAGKQAIRNKYLEAGYHFAEVEIDQKALERNREVIYTVVEGPRTIIKKVRFQGNHYFGNFSLKMRTESKAKFWPFITGAYNTEKVERDVTTIRNLYIADGFLDAEVARKAEFSDDKKTVVITFVIKEGPRYRIDEVIFEGNTVFADPELARRLGLQRGEFFTAEVLRNDLETLEDAYGELGYIDAKVEAEKVFRSPDRPSPDWAAGLDGGKPALLNLVFDIREEDQYRIGEVRITGNSITQSRVIRRELHFRPEQLYDTVAVRYSKNRLQELRLFDEVNITPVDTDEPGVKDVVVDITEGRTAEFLIGVGVSTNSGLLGTVSFTQRNFDILAWPKSFKHLLKPETFKGAGQRFSIVAEPGTELMRYSINWFTPYIFDQPYSLGTKGYFFTRSYEDYDINRLGGQLSLGHMFKNRWYGELAMRGEGVRMEDVDNYAPVEVIEDEGTHTLIGFTGRIVRDRTDSRWLPSKGDRLSLSYEQVVGSDTFGTFMTDYRRYYTVYVDALDRKHIVAGRVSFGHIVGDAPVFEKFYGGGIGSIRGFEYRGISPRGTYASGAKHDDPIGGDTMFFAGVEYTFPLVADQLRGALFLDTGTVEEDFGISTYRASLGFGLRWTIPMFGPVPMRFDFGFPVAKDDDDDTQIFSFSLGVTF
jgi:outer membrane protein insertion porin family